MSFQIKLTSIFYGIILFVPLCAYAQIKPEIADDSFIVVWEKNTSTAQRKTAAVSQYSGASFKSLKNLKTVDIVYKKPNTPLEEQMRLTKQIPGVKNVYPNYIRKISSFRSASTTPNDTDFNELWGLDNSNDYDINAPEAWDVNTGSDDVYIVVIDTGIDYTHEDLAENIWVNEDEIPDNGIDDDNNGWIDDIHGIDTVNQDGDPLDDHNHGTHVAGTIAAVGNNAQGVVGVAWNAGLIACKFLNEYGYGDDVGALQCLDYILDLKQNKGLNIVASNNSWGGGGYSQPLYDAIAEQMEAGILFVAAAGNWAYDNDIYPAYPASYDLENIISVAASTELGQLAYFSNFGRASVDIAAPGDEIYSTTIDNTYESFSGTSMAAPHVAGATVLLKSNKPELSWSGIKNTLLATARHNANYSGRILTGDLRLWDENGTGAINCKDQNIVSRTLPVENNSSIHIGQTFVISVSSVNCDQPGDVPQLVSSQGVVPLVDDGTGVDSVAGDGIFSAELEVTWIGENIFKFENLPSYDFSVTGYEAPEFETIEYNYTEIDGTPLYSSYNSIELDFSITLPDGEKHQKLFVSQYGVIEFIESYLGSYNQELPLLYYGQPHFFAPFWDYISRSFSYEGTTLSYDIIGEAPNRQVVIEYENFTDCCYYNPLDDDYNITFQVVFHESKAAIDVFYKDVTASNVPLLDKGTGATVGYQKHLAYVQYSAFEPALEDEMALRLTQEDRSIPNVNEFSLEGVLKPFQPLILNVGIDEPEEGVDLTVKLDLDDGAGYQEISLVEAISLSLDAGFYKFSLALEVGSIQVLHTLNIEVVPYTELELALIENARVTTRIATIDEVQGDPATFDLVSLLEHEATIADTKVATRIATIDEVKSDPATFDLVSLVEHEATIADTKVTTRAVTIDEVKGSPATFDLVSVVEHEQIIADTKVATRESTIDEVKGDPATFDLISIADSEELRTQAYADGQANVVEFPAEFGLFTQTDMDTHKLNAELALLDAVAAAPVQYGYVTLAQNAFDIASSAANTRAEVIANPTDYDLVSKENHEATVQKAAQDSEANVLTNPHDFDLTPIVNDGEDLAALASGQLHMVGMSLDFTGLSETFADARFVWVYRDGAFVGWSPQESLREQITNSGYTLLTDIKAGEGVWVSK